MHINKLLYITHVPWNCIMQRTQFIAKGLSAYYDITVAFKMEYQKQVHNEEQIKVIRLFRLPYERISGIKMLNDILCRIQVFFLIRNYDTIWFTHPSLLSLFFEKTLRGKKIIYDCMDDMLEFPVSEKELLKIRLYESKLYSIADIIISSADYLKLKLISRYGNKQIHVVNNAMKSLPRNFVEPPFNISEIFVKTNFNVVYIGTISSWFDIELVNYLLENVSDLHLFLFGPIENNNITLPTNPRIHYCGLVEHKYVNGVMNLADILIMPFVITELIQSVNPVKLYEYISTGKPCLAPKYSESEKFNDYVYLYESKEQCLSYILQIKEQRIFAKQNLSKCIEYIKDNTWEQRINSIVSILKKEL